MNQGLRNKLRGVVTQCRKLLEDATAQALQGRFGVYAGRQKGEVQIEDEARMAHLTGEDRACRQDLLDHLGHIQAIGYKPSEALEQLVREIAFTHLNRLCAYKMMESRGLIREAVSRGLKSQGFFFYLADYPEAEKLHNSGQQDLAYRNFLDWLGGTLSQEIGVLFNPNDPANRIYPPQRVLDEVLALINDGELRDIWSQDETIGWVYQYFTPKELRDKARKESQAPRNSYELAFRNQFFTPRYVVEFLTDNTLGRIWYEMRKGKTALTDRCRYLVRRPTEIFLQEGDEPPAESKDTREDLSQEELLKQPVYIPHRPKKDPREIKILDPACGSGHFLLYCFDLLQTIYEEAYDDPALGAALRKDHPAIEDLRRAVPGLILKHNLHGIDIDLRATQIAALALWLRCQRAYQDLGLKNGERPKITRSNIVCAEPMPGETDLLKEFTATLQPKVLGQLVDAVFEEMKLAGEAGSLLKIEEEIREAAGKAKFEFIQWKKHQDKAKWSLFPELVERDQPSLFDFSDITDEVFLDRVEEEIVAALRNYAEKASNGKGFRRRLFAEDAARGFSFVDVCRKMFDVVLMNPPFGEPCKDIREWLGEIYPHAKQDIFCEFIERAVCSLHSQGLIGAITSRTCFFLSSFRNWREHLLINKAPLKVAADLGHGVLDAALVETTAYVLAKHSQPVNGGDRTFFARLIGEVNKAPVLLECINFLRQAQIHRRAYMVSIADLNIIPGSPIAYWITPRIRRLFDTHQPFAADGRHACVTNPAGDDSRYIRTSWEIHASMVGKTVRWVPLAKGGEYSPYYSDVHLLIDWDDDRQTYRGFYGTEHRPLERPASIEHFFRPGVTWPRSTIKGFNARALPAGSIFADKGPCAFVVDNSHEDLHTILAIMNSRCFEFLAFIQHGSRAWEVGFIKRVPFPKLTQDARQHLGTLAKNCIERRQWCDTGDETSHAFIVPHIVRHSGGTITYAVSQLSQEITQLEENDQKERASVNDVVYGAYDLSEEDRHVIESHFVSNAEPGLDESNLGLLKITPESNVVSILSYSIGLSTGRWDLRLAIGERELPELLDPFASLPNCPPGMLQDADGLPAKPEDVSADYPIRIDWDGILVDDPEHEDDIIRRIRDVLEVIWKDRAEAIEREACEILGVRELRDYFRKPGNGGFWMDHVKRYSKSRRKAPIYWYLRSAKGNYGLWLYYHRLDKDILFKALLNYVEPRIRLEEDRLKTLRGRKEAAGSSGREAKLIEKDMDRQEQFLSELHDFADKLRRAANRHLDFDLNDGVILNIAPLWELVPWSEPKTYWQELQEGKYDWSHVAYQLWPERVQEACRKDRSIAIAHGREDLCADEPVNAGKKKRTTK